MGIAWQRLMKDFHADFRQYLFMGYMETPVMALFI
jgi:hypothetical protein